MFLLKALLNKLLMLINHFSDFNPSADKTVANMKLSISKPAF